VVVNVPCSQGASGFATALAPTFTVGTGYFGRSSIGENVGPQHLIHWTRLAYNSSDEEVFGNYQDIPGNFSGPLPVAPADGVPGLSRYAPKQAINTDGPGALVGASREDLRKLIAEELRAILRN